MSGPAATIHTRSPLSAHGLVALCLGIIGCPAALPYDPMTREDLATFTFDATQDVEWEGDLALPGLGGSVAALGDVDGDGLGDFAVASESMDQHCSSSFYPVWCDELVYYPTSGLWAHGMTPTTFVLYGAEDPRSRNLALDLWQGGLGIRVDSAGDFNGDGLGDLLRSDGLHLDYLTNRPVVLMSFGSPDPTEIFPERQLTGADAISAYLAQASVTWLIDAEDVLAVRDWNGDGRGDLLVGERSKDGATYTRTLMGGADDPAQSEAIFEVTLTDDTWDQSLGYEEVGSMGDLDGDGVADFAFRSNGAVQVAFGSDLHGQVAAPDATLTFVSGLGGDSFGQSLALDGDVDGDGYADLLASEPDAMTQGIPDLDDALARGRLYVFAGDPTPSSRSSTDAERSMEARGLMFWDGNMNEGSGERKHFTRVGYAGEVDGRTGDEVWASADLDLALWSGADIVDAIEVPRAVLSRYWLDPAWHEDPATVHRCAIRAAFGDADGNGRADLMVPRVAGDNPLYQDGTTLILAEELIP